MKLRLVLPVSTTAALSQEVVVSHHRRQRSSRVVSQRTPTIRLRQNWRPRTGQYETLWMTRLPTLSSGSTSHPQCCRSLFRKARTAARVKYQEHMRLAVRRRFTGLHLDQILEATEIKTKKQEWRLSPLNWFLPPFMPSKSLHGSRASTTTFPYHKSLRATLLQTNRRTRRTLL